MSDEDRARRHPRPTMASENQRKAGSGSAERAGGRSVLEKLLPRGLSGSDANGRDVGIQDMGAAGLTCSTCEMGARGGTGVEIELIACEPRPDMTLYEIMLSGVAGAHVAWSRRGPRRRGLRVLRSGAGCGEIGQVTRDGEDARA